MNRREQLQQEVLLRLVSYKITVFLEECKRKMAQAEPEGLILNQKEKIENILLRLDSYKVTVFLEECKRKMEQIEADKP